MIECRPITRGAEEEAFLTVLCKVFDLEIERARVVFFNEPFFDLGRKWALFEDGRIATILTTAPLEFGWGRAVGIAGVGTLPESRMRGHATRLVAEALDKASRDREGAALLFANSPRVYERAGFTVLDEVVRCDLAYQRNQPPAEALTNDEVRETYGKWAEGDDDRLRRDDRRWRYWEWVSRPCEPYGGGYICHEAMLCREAVVYTREDAWPVMPGSQWTGLKSMTSRLGVPAGPPRHELWLMGRGFPRVPQMFMTDQF